jgi:polyhydroxyalkanoate synthesis regulator phasin
MKLSILLRRLPMIDIIKKSMMVGVGLAFKAVDEVEKMVKELEKKGKMSEKDGRQFLKDLRKKYDDAQKKIENKVETTGKEFVKKVNVVTSDDLHSLIKEIRELKKAHITTADELNALKKEIMSLKDTAGKTI